MKTQKQTRSPRRTKRTQPETPAPEEVLDLFHISTAEWFRSAFGHPTAPQRLGWPAIARGENTLILAPTGTGKTLTAFLWCLNRLMFNPVEEGERGCRILYVSPLKALAVDVERNLRAPLAGIAETARNKGFAVRQPEISVRTGDTPQKERARFRRHPAEILITTPESLYLLLTSGAAASLRTVDTVILDEIHALVQTKRGAHLALSLERLEALVAGSRSGHRIQRIGLSATQRPLEEVARFLGGTEGPPPIEEPEPSFGSRQGSVEGSGPTAVADFPSLKLLEEESLSKLVAYRPVTIIQAAEPKTLKLRVEVPVEDMANPGRTKETSPGARRPTIWSAIESRLVELIRQRHSTIVFVNSRRIAERLAAAINELADEPLARAHHGSLAAAKRAEIEDQLKAGQLQALVATSSLELGIDMGAVDLVIQIEAPPSVAAAIQRIGRAGHSVGAPSEGILFPKYRGDLVACAAATRAMHEGLVEPARYLRSPLDVLAQQIVAIVAQPPPAIQANALKKNASKEPAPVSVDALFALLRRAAPFAILSRQAFYDVLDSLSGHYPSDEFAELRPRVTWDREKNILLPREGSKMLAILNGGTIPDRGLYGVFLSGTEGKPIRVGELDEEMVFESRTNDVFTLGASTWRIDQITHDRVLVSPAPGKPGKTPFWHGDAAGRPLEFGQRIGRLMREITELPPAAAISRLARDHDLAPQAAENLIRYLADQKLSTGAIPEDRAVVIERTRDELGDWRVCVLAPFGGRIHAPWAMAVTRKIRAAGGPDVEAMWGDDGFVLRFPDMDRAPNPDPILLDPSEVTKLVLLELGGSALFAAKFRENAARALLLPRQSLTRRAPLWQQRKRASDLLSVAARYPSFPVLLETFRECLRDVFDIPALVETLDAIQRGQMRVHVADTTRPSPFASSLLFRYVANSIYDGDAPLAERRAQALSVDQNRLRELLGEADLRELLDAHAIAEIEKRLQGLQETGRVHSPDGIHDLLLRVGDLSRAELGRRLASPELAKQTDRLVRARRILEIKIAGEKRLIAAEDAARYRDALGAALPSGLPKALLQPVAEPALELIRRFARTHGPFGLDEVSSRFGLPAHETERALQTLTLSGRVVEGGFRPAGASREWCDAEVLRMIRQKSLARLRREIEPVEQPVLARLSTQWQGVFERRRGLDALLDTIEHLQGAPLPASLLESAILPARLSAYSPGQLDTLIGAGEVVWCGLGSIGEHDGRIALFLSDKLSSLLAPRPDTPGGSPFSPREEALLDRLGQSGADFFAQLHEAVGGGFPGATLDALWTLVWRGLVTNDTFHALRGYLFPPAPSRQSKRPHNLPAFRSRRTTPPAAQGRWSLVPPVRSSAAEWSLATAHQLLYRYGIVMREIAAEENLPGGFSAIYEALKAMEAQGGVRRGYFVAGLGATQFALPAAVEMLRALRKEPPPEKAEMVYLAATDPANPYGSLLRWPQPADAAAERDESPARMLSRSVGASVILRNGALAAYLRRNNPNLEVFLPTEEPERSQAARDLCHFLASIVHEEMRSGQDRRAGILISTINGRPAGLHFLRSFLIEAGFRLAPRGFNLGRIAPAESSHS